MKKTRISNRVKQTVFLLCIFVVFTGCGKKSVAEQVNGNTENEIQEETVLRPTIEEELDAVESERQSIKTKDEIAEQQVMKNPRTCLNIPTDIEKIGDTYFIVDCYNNQVIYSKELEAPLPEWNVMCDCMQEGHTIASDGKVYIIDDTENNRVLVYEEIEDQFVLTQILKNIGERPHYVRYDVSTNAFYVLSSMTGELYVIRIKDREDSHYEAYVDEIKRFDEMSGTYCRSFTIEDDRILLPVSNGTIVEATFPNCKVKNMYTIPDEIAGLVQIYHINQKYYLTVSTNKEGNQDYANFIVTDSLQQLAEGNYQYLYDILEPDRETIGTPYNLSYFDNHYYLVEHRHGHGLFQFDVENHQIKDVKIIM